MRIRVYGKENCIYCHKTKELINKLQTSLVEEIHMDYYDITKEDLTSNDLSYIMGEPVTTVPQILIDGTPLQGGYTGFDNYIRTQIIKGNLTFK